MDMSYRMVASSYTHYRPPWFVFSGLCFLKATSKVDFSSLYHYRRSPANHASARNVGRAPFKGPSLTRY